MRKGSKVIKIKYEEDSIFVGAAWGRKRTRWGRKGARLTLEAISDYLKKELVCIVKRLIWTK